jgi:hypothetical protein
MCRVDLLSIFLDVVVDDESRVFASGAFVFDETRPRERRDRSARRPRFLDEESRFVAQSARGRVRNLRARSDA